MKVNSLGSLSQQAHNVNLLQSTFDYMWNPHFGTAGVEPDLHRVKIVCKFHMYGYVIFTIKEAIVLQAVISPSGH